MQRLEFPLTAIFRVLALSPEVQVRDAQGALLMQVKQKLLTLREDTTVFADADKTRPLYRMRADRISGFRAVHTITSADTGVPLGAVRATGIRSLWRARYDVTNSAGREVTRIQEENPWIKVIDGLVDSIPLIGPLVAMFINPSYLVVAPDGSTYARISKKRSLVDRRFTLDRTAPNPNDVSDELLALALIQVVLLERSRD